jgi:hypothetical protein
MDNNIAPPYNPYTLYTDGCTTLECLQTLAAPSSLQQGQTFDRLTARLHGGRRGRKGSKKNGRKSRKMRGRKVRGGGDEPALYPSQFSSMLPLDYQMRAAAQLGPVVDPPTNKFAHNYSGGALRQLRKLKAHGKMRKGTKKHRGGASWDPVAYPSQFNETLPQELVPLSRTSILDTSIADLAQFNGKYGMLQSGGKRNKRKTHRKHRGGMAPVDSSGMILPPDMEPAAYLNPQWYTENLVVPSYKAPDNSYALASYAQQAYENQIAYRNHNPAAIPVPPPPGIGGGRRSRRNRNRNRKNRRSNKNRKSRR